MVLCSTSTRCCSSAAALASVSSKARFSASLMALNLAASRSASRCNAQAVVQQIVFCQLLMWNKTGLEMFNANLTTSGAPYQPNKASWHGAQAQGQQSSRHTDITPCQTLSELINMTGSKPFHISPITERALLCIWPPSPAGALQLPGSSFWL